VSPDGEAVADVRRTTTDVRAAGLRAPVHASVRIRTLGGCGLDVDGRRASLDRAKPRVRSLMRLLAIHAGAPVHREVIQEALWPESDADAGARSLHVAVSALRRLLDDVAQPVGGRLLVRDGDAYRLDVPPDSVDLGRFDRAIAEGRAARSRGEVSAAAFSLALELYAGELLPEEGPADWVIERREHYRAKAIEAAIGLAEEAMLGADYATTVRACRFGLELDRYQDTLWRMLIDARDRAGDAGAASRDRREYASVLEGLGVEAPVAISPF
jgi:DNA-binding SARP family transcriptional activator